ncbi:hypothetical protein H4R35_000501 [Dimargaris xerosporica]|nr:hypothetical protein H4R35_000501 [Dimargaris xerosporica]
MSDESEALQSIRASVQALNIYLQRVVKDLHTLADNYQSIAGECSGHLHAAQREQGGA